MAKIFSWIRDCLLDRRAQISVELIIIMAAVVALVLMLVSQLQSTGADAKERISTKSEDVFKEIDKIK
ncbi:MAG: class III signal peptide-containing protein [Candidatus Diapherotrites archaeon]|nr:class III signal peptide-containing protein [Candidatus Diapherotrites archaeon]